MQSMADFLVAHLGHADTPAECTPEAESLWASAARSAQYAAAFTHSLGESSVHWAISGLKGSDRPVPISRGGRGV